MGSILGVLAAAAVILMFWAQDSQAAPDSERNRVILVAGICSEPQSAGVDVNTDASEGGVGVPEHNLGEIRRWLIDDLGYRDLPDAADGNPDPADEIVYFSYRFNNQLPYFNSDTVISVDQVDGGLSSGVRLQLLIDKMTGPGEKVDIISHSQGGVVALWAALDPATAGSINSIVTIGSPVRGIDLILWELLFVASVIPTELVGLDFCGDLGDSDSPWDLIPSSDVISQIVQKDWAAKDAQGVVTKTKPYVVNVANLTDPIVSDGVELSFDLFCCGERGILANSHPTDPNKYRYQAGGTFLAAHQLALNVLTNSAAQPTKDAIIEALLTNWEASGVFFSTRDSSLVAHTSTTEPAVQPVNTSAYVGNGDGRLDVATTANGVTLGFSATGAYVGNGDGRLDVATVANGVTLNFAATGAYVGNGDGRVDRGLSKDDLLIEPIARSVYVGNGDGRVDAALSSTGLTIAPVSTRPYMSNGDGRLSTTLSLPAFAEPKVVDLAVTKSDSRDPVSAGAQLTYTIGVTNNGPDPATGVTLVDTLPDGVAFVSSVPGAPACTEVSGVVTCSLGGLTSGQSTQVTIVVNIDPGLLDGVSVTNQTTIAANEPDPDKANNTAAESTVVTAIICGDVHPAPEGDGDVDVLDALRTLKFAVVLITPDTRELNAGDVQPDNTTDPDGDNDIDVLDAQRVLKAAVGLVSITSCGGPTT